MPRDNSEYSMTPVPTDDLRSLIGAVSGISIRVKAIQEEQLPPVAAAAKEARDGVIILTERDKSQNARLRALESGEHFCLKEREISAHEKELAGLSKWRWWLMGIIVTALLISSGWAMNSEREVTVIHTDHASTKRDVERHEKTIEALTKTAAQNHLELLVELQKVPTRVKEVVPQRTIEDALVEAGVNERERERIIRAIERTKNRQGAQ